MDKLLERFLHYVSLDTQSKSGVRQVPSTEGQWKLRHCCKVSDEAAFCLIQRPYISKTLLT
ncbi:hypothetical protein, partial [Salmonella enterica]|uniref:hypothetical protein n=1 Tax=Salmonella enterica TaxID=28901 RepID=UPI000A5FAB73